MKHLWMPFMLLALIFATSTNAQDGERVISVQGRGTIQAIPDVIRIDYSISEIASSDLSAAKGSVDTRASSSIRSLKELGVPESDVTSPGLVVETMLYDYDGNLLDEPQSLVTRNLELLLNDTELYSRVIQALVDAGISEINRIAREVSNYEELRLQALAAAAANAREEAIFIAGKLGAEVGEVLRIGKQSLRRQFSMDEIVVTGSKREEEVPTISYEFNPGTVEVSAELYVEFVLE